ncbi:hypothetical protein AKJ09_03689 [Labilithrix luteola]|uniref:Uncharacterized protein n=1 Tax=Labilithrix luteola TaxID=1391654 RepID=A0A0K1PU14_9BACT|nr:hypothetical protein AKJ09_03689 [Labilithrix luteola]
MTVQPSGVENTSIGFRRFGSGCSRSMLGQSASDGNFIDCPPLALKTHTRVCAQHP